jgi:phosphoglycolate phosphatase
MPADARPADGPRLVVFDFDGTLVDSQHMIIAAMARAFTGLRLPPPADERVRRAIGLPLEQVIERLAPDEPMERRARLVELYKQAFFDLRQQPDHFEPMFPGALAALDALTSAGLQLGIATGKGRRGLMFMVEKLGLADRFAVLQSADDAPGKPHPGMLLNAMAATGIDPSSTVMIGDTSFDMAMAVNAGVRGIGVAWGYHPADELARAGATTIVGRFDEVPEAVLAAGSWR